MYALDCPVHTFLQFYVLFRKHFLKQYIGKFISKNSVQIFFLKHDLFLLKKFSLRFPVVDTFTVTTVRMIYLHQNKQPAKCLHVCGHVKYVYSYKAQRHSSLICVTNTNAIYQYLHYLLAYWRTYSQTINLCLALYSLYE